MRKNLVQQSRAIRHSYSLYFTFLVTISAFVFVYLRGQDINWDLLNYHYYAGYSLLDGRYLQDIAAANIQSFFNPVSNVFAYLSLKHLPFPFTAWSFLAIQLLSIPVLVLIAREIGMGLGYTNTSSTEVLALLLSVIAPLWWSELGTTFFSSWTAPLILWGLYLLLRNYSVRSSLWNGLSISGFLFGLAAGLKLTNAPFAVAAFAALLYLASGQSWKASAGKSLLFVFCAIFGFSITAWWNWHLWSMWKSPLFPLYNAIFKSPYFDLTNFSDIRWHFNSPADLLNYFLQAVYGTDKTSEIHFADARLILIASLLPGTILFKPAKAFSREIVALFLFVLLGFTLWVVTLAYQRYLIPLELLFGLVIWILIVRLIERERLRVFVLACMVAFSAYMVKIPDWGHARSEFGSKNSFSIEMRNHFSATPARYIVVGVPISYVLPSFHPGSVFYGIGTSKQIDELIIKKLVEPSLLPLRILARDHDAETFPERLKAFGFNSSSHALDCGFFKTVIGRYIVCEVNLQTQHGSAGNCLVEADFSQANHLRTEGFLWDKGLSVIEPWGRWSDGETVELGLANCLPTGALRLSVTGHAFGPNIGKPVRFVLGTEERAAMFDGSAKEVSVRFFNQDQCARRLLIRIPVPASPRELGLSSDARKLGIGFVRIKFFRE